MNNEGGSNMFEEMQKRIIEDKQNTDIQSKLLNRNQYFNKNADISAFRNEQHHNELSLRKNNRNEEFDVRRRFTSVLNDTSTSMKSFAFFSDELKEKIEQIQTKNEMLELYLGYLKSTNLEEKYFGLVAIRKLLAQSIKFVYLGRNAPITEVVNSGLVPIFLEFLNDEKIDFQYEALWCLTNISSGDSEDTYSIISKNGIELIMKKFDSNVAEIQEQVF